MLLNTRTVIVLLSCHAFVTTIRIVANHETVFNAWYPFDWNISPFYELVNISQVNFLNKYENRNIYISSLNYVVFVINEVAC